MRYGYRCIQVLLRYEGIRVNKKRVYRLNCEEGLQLRAKRPRRHVTAATRRSPAVRPLTPNVACSKDFVSDQTAAGQRFRALTVVDVFSRECLAIEPGQKLGSVSTTRVGLTGLSTTKPPLNMLLSGLEKAGNSQAAWLE